jgi:hypothetical protein
MLNAQCGMLNAECSMSSGFTIQGSGVQGSPFAVRAAIGFVAKRVVHDLPEDSDQLV